MGDDAKSLRSGFTTGACAAAAAKAAALLLTGKAAPKRLAITLPDGLQASFAIEFARKTKGGAEAGVIKDAGDDPDITDGAIVIALLEPLDDGDIEFAAGAGVGKITKPGLQLPPGEPAINPAPRLLICKAIREAAALPLKVTISIPGGEELAQKTFNPKLGIEGGLSILGTSGHVRPYSHEALREALLCSLKVARAAGICHIALVPGNIGNQAVRAHFILDEDQVAEASNEWGFMLDQLKPLGFGSALLAGHPGKLAKLAEGEWDTHSSRSQPALPYVKRLADSLGIKWQTEAETVEGFFASLNQAEKKQLGNELAEQIRQAAERRTKLPMAAHLCAMDASLLGEAGELAYWRRK